MEGRLFAAERTILPFRTNISTLADFLLLDPFGIYFIARSYSAISKLNGDPFVPVTSWRSFVSLAAAAIVTMALYVRNSLTAPVRDATIVSPGLAGITATGWVVFTWTTLFIYVLYCGAYVQLRYGKAIAGLSIDRVDYQPLHQDNSGGLRLSAQPALEFLRAMVLLFLVFVLFYVQDRFIYELKGSWRLVQGSIVYVVVAPILFLMPLLKLHRLMVQSRDLFIARVNERLSETMIGLSTRASDFGTLARDIEAIVKIRREIQAFTVWPLPVRQMAESFSYLVGPFAPFVPYILKLLLPTLFSAIRLGSTNA